MDARHLDVLQHAAHEHLLAVAERVEVHLHRAFEEAVEVHGWSGEIFAASAMYFSSWAPS